MKTHVLHTLCSLVLLTVSAAGLAQPAIELVNGSGTTLNGSMISNQVATFKNNALNPVTGTYTTLTPTTTATFSISNQQYILPATQNPNGGDLSFGANVNGGGKTPSSALLFPAMNALSAPPAADFSATQNNIGSGMSMSANYATELFTSAMGLYNANAPTNGTYYIADLTITFNLPVTDPVMHIVGLGGTFGALGLTTQLVLQTGGVTLSELSGSTELSVTGASILNTAANPAATTGAGAASGSILITGTVSTLTFKVYLRGNGKTPTWSNINEHTGDAWLMGFSAINSYVALPLALTAFTAEPAGHAVNLQWTSAQEINSSYFVVERSANSSDWTPIGRVAAAGNSRAVVAYAFADNDPEAGANYYRLRLIDIDGNSTWSGIREVTCSGVADAASATAIASANGGAGDPIELNFYPNPVRDRLTICSSAPLRSVTLTTLGGRTLQTCSSFLPGQSLDLSHYPAGLYFLVIRTAAGQTRTTRIERL